MAVNVGETTRPQLGGNNESTTTTFARTEQAAPRRTTGGFGQSLRSIHRSYGRRSMSNVLAAYIKSFQEIIDSDENYREKKYSINVFALDGGNNNVPVSSVVITREEQGFLVAQPVIIGATGSNYGERYYRSGNNADGSARQIVLPQTATDIWEKSKIYRKLINDEIRQRAGERDFHLFPAMLLNETVTPEDVDTLKAVLFRAVDGVENYLSYKGLFSNNVLSLQSLENDEYLKGKITFNQPQTLDELGFPRRSDVLIEVFAQYGEGDVEKDEPVLQVSAVTAYVDAIYEGRDVSESRSNDWNPDNMATFVPGIIITSLDTMQNAMTGETLAMTLYNASLLSNDNRWLGALKSRNGDKFRHVGALGRQLPQPGSPILTGQADFEEEWGVVPNDLNFSYLEFCRAAFYWDSPVYFIDIPESGPMVPLLSTITDIAIKRSDSALRAFLGFCDNLTGGEASRIYKDMGSPDLFVNTDLRLPLGTVKLDPNSDQDYDLRFVDQIYLNNEEQELQDVFDYNDAFYDSVLSGEERTEKIVRYLDSRFNGIMKISSYARRIQITSAFMEMMRDAFLANGAPIDIDDNLDTLRARSRGGRWKKAGYRDDNRGVRRRGRSSRGSSWGGFQSGGYNR